MIKFILIIVAVFFYTSCSIISPFARQKPDISPYDYGLSNAKSDVERYNVLLNTHNAAVAAGVKVDYSGIDTIRIEVPAKPTPIPLTQYNDFKGCVFIVKNVVNNCWLFRIKEEGIPIVIPKQAIDDGDFRSVASLKRGRYLLVIEDKYPWVLNRRGYDYGHQRRDILLIENGSAHNRVIMSYNNEYSSPQCVFVKVKNTPLVVKNITIERTPDCTKITHVAFISGYNDVRLSNIRLITPDNNLNNDRGIRIYNCTNVTLEDIIIDGTYSQPNQSGYGVNMNNVWNFKAERMHGKAEWGIFGNNNINVARIENSQINRFDIHCYGRDISFKHVEFFDHFNRYASVYGTIKHKDCTFTDFVPVLNEGSYNAYVDHKVEFVDCIVNLTPKKNSIFRFSRLDDPPNKRPELVEKCLPDVYIRNLTVNVNEGVKEFFLFRCSTSGMELTDIGGLSKIDIDGLEINVKGPTPLNRISLSNITMKTKHPVYCQMKDVNEVWNGTNANAAVSGNTVSLRANFPLYDGKVVLKNVQGIKQE